MNRKNRQSRLVENIEEVTTTFKSVFHGSNQVAHSILDCHFGEQATAASNTTALERAFQLKSQTTIRSRDVHLKATVIRAALAMAAIRLFGSKEVRQLVLTADAVWTGEEYVVAILRLEASEDLPGLHSLPDKQTANYALTAGGVSTIGKNIQVVDS